MAAKLKGISRLKNLKSMTMNILMNSGNLLSPSEKAKFLVADVFSRSSKDSSAIQPENISKRSMIMSTDNLLAELTFKKTGPTETELNRQALIIGLMALCHRMLLPVIW